MVKQNNACTTTVCENLKATTLFECLETLQININELIATLGINIDKPIAEQPVVPHLVEDVERCIAGVQFANQDILSITEFVLKARQLIKDM